MPRRRPVRRLCQRLAFDDRKDVTHSRHPRPGDRDPLSTLSSPFAGRYEIRECVGLGAGGTVYSAYDPELERIIALKVLRGGELQPDGSTKLGSKWTRETSRCICDEVNGPTAAHLDTPRPTVALRSRDTRVASHGTPVATMSWVNTEFPR
ncbi:MAG: hypothetical protein JKY37_19745 [Nannocystaceae bacterium]|nr:hypothetical protein [Nannocystaceae bacterium]